LPRHARIPAGLLDEVPPGPAKVLVLIAGHLNVHTSTAHVSLARLCAQSGYDRRHLRRLLRHLEDLGLLVTTPGRGRGRVSSYLCPWHLFTVGRNPMNSPVDNPEKVSPTPPFSMGKGGAHVPEKGAHMSPPINTTEKNNSNGRGDPRACTHGITWGNRLDEYGVSTGGCTRCEHAGAFAWRTGKAAQG
jgi:hypothetical protein